MYEINVTHYAVEINVPLLYVHSKLKTNIIIEHNIQWHEQQQHVTTQRTTTKPVAI